MTRHCRARTRVSRQQFGEEPTRSRQSRRSGDHPALQSAKLTPSSSAAASVLVKARREGAMQKSLLPTGARGLRRERSSNGCGSRRTTDRRTLALPDGRGEPAAARIVLGRSHLGRGRSCACPIWTERDHRRRAVRPLGDIPGAIQECVDLGPHSRRCCFWRARRHRGVRSPFSRS